MTKKIYLETLKSVAPFYITPSLVSSGPAKMNILLILSKGSWKAEIKLLPYGAIT